MKIKYIGAHPIAVMGVGYCGIVDIGDVIEVDQKFFDEVKLSKKWVKVVAEEQKKQIDKEQK